MRARCWVHDAVCWLSASLSFSVVRHRRRHATVLPCVSISEHYDTVVPLRQPHCGQHDYRQHNNDYKPDQSVRREPVRALADCAHSRSVQCPGAGHIDRQYARGDGCHYSATTTHAFQSAHYVSRNLRPPSRTTWHAVCCYLRGRPNKLVELFRCSLFVSFVELESFSLCPLS